MTLVPDAITLTCEGSLRPQCGLWRRPSRDQMAGRAFPCSPVVHANGDPNALPLEGVRGVTFSLCEQPDIFIV